MPNLPYNPGRSDEAIELVAVLHWYNLCCFVFSHDDFLFLQHLYVPGGLEAVLKLFDVHVLQFCNCLSRDKISFLNGVRNWRPQRRNKK